MIRLLKYFRPYYWIYVILIFLLVYLQVSAELKMPDLLTNILNEAGIIAAYRQAGIPVLDSVVAAAKDEIVQSGLMMLMYACFSILANVVTAYLASRIAAGYSHDIRKEVYKKVQSMSLTDIDGFSTASLITRTTNDVTQTQMVIVMVLRIALSAPIMAVKGIINASKQASNSGLNYLVIAGVIALAILITTLFVIVFPKFKIMQKNTDDLNLVTRENLSGIRVVRANNAQEYEEEKFASVNNRLTKLNIFVNRTISLMDPGMRMIMNMTSLGILWVGAYAINDKKLLIGDVFGFQQYTMMICMAFMQLIMIFIMIPRGQVSANRILEVLNTKSSVTDPIEGKVGNEIGTVEFKNVSFSYPNSDEPVIQNISFKINYGETLAIIGSTGSGKSTILNLLNRFYDPTSGEILVDGVNIKEYKQEDLRAKIGFIPQKSNLFIGSIKSNLMFGNPNPTDEDIDRALKVSQAYEFVSNLEDGINSWVAQGGSNFSGGQKQRLCIARAIIKKPEIYSFDDSFSALDLKTDKMLRDALKNDTHKATNIIVAQRIGTIMDADRIIVLEDGKIAGMGTHKELLDSCTVYQEIAYSQLPKEEL